MSAQKIYKKKKASETHICLGHRQSQIGSDDEDVSLE